MINPYENNLKHMYSDAVQVQNASNLTGVVNSFLDAIKATKQMGYFPGTDPAVLAFLFKIMDMCGYPDTKVFMNALKRCEELSKVD